MSGVDCEYGVYVTFVDRDGAERSQMFYMRTRVGAESLALTLRNAGKILIVDNTETGSVREIPIRTVGSAKL